MDQTIKKTEQESDQTEKRQSENWTECGRAENENDVEYRVDRFEVQTSGLHCWHNRNKNKTETNKWSHEKEKKKASNGDDNKYKQTMRLASFSLRPL